MLAGVMDLDFLTMARHRALDLCIQSGPPAFGVAGGATDVAAYTCIYLYFI
jgi:hypothetical protein